MTNDITLEAVRERERESYTLVNKSGLLNLIINSTTLCALKNIKISKKTEIKPIK